MCLFNVVGFLHILSLSYFWSNLISICPSLSLLDLLFSFHGALCVFMFIIVVVVWFIARSL
jgi:hypothetical protein